MEPAAASLARLLFRAASRSSPVATAAVTAGRPADGCANAAVLGYSLDGMHWLNGPVGTRPAGVEYSMHHVSGCMVGQRAEGCGVHGGDGTGSPCGTTITNVNTNTSSTRNQGNRNSSNSRSSSSSSSSIGSSFAHGDGSGSFRIPSSVNAGSGSSRTGTHAPLALTHGPAGIDTALSAEHSALWHRPAYRTTPCSPPPIGPRAPTNLWWGVPSGMRSNTRRGLSTSNVASGSAAAADSAPQRKLAALGDDAAQARDQAAARAAGRSRFFRSVEVRPAPGGTPGHAIFMGRYAVKTPARKVLAVPTAALAAAVAAEWEWQESMRPAPHTMPLTSLVATVLDQPKPRRKVVDTVLKYLDTDAALCRYEPGPLADRQAAVFDPVIEWARDELSWCGLHTSDSIFGTQQDVHVVMSACALVEGLDPWELAAVEQLTACSKSLLVALAMLRGLVVLPGRAAPPPHGLPRACDGPLMGIADGVTAARLEELFQTDEWGEVEAGHDLDRADVGSRMAAPVIMMKLLRMP